MKINWSGKSHNLNNKEKKYLFNMLDKADILSQGPELDKFESSLRNYLGSKNVMLNQETSLILVV